jgi:hypothetical protein
MAILLIILAIILLIIWTFVWKALALWKSARKGDVAWFIVMSLVNTLGILEILYIYIFSEKSNKKFRRHGKRIKFL